MNCEFKSVKKTILKKTLGNLKFYQCLFSAFLLLTVGLLQAQDSKIDSLKNELANHKTMDSTRVNLLYSLAFSHFQRDLNITQAYLKKAEHLSDSLDYRKGRSKILYLKGILENRKSNYEKSLAYFKQALALDQSIGNLLGMAANYTAFGITHYDQSQYNEAIKAYDNALEIYKKLGNKREQVTILINSGNAYSEMGRLNEAISNYNKALKDSEAMNDEDGISFVHSNLGEVYKIQGNYPLAIDHLNKSLDYDIKTRDTIGMAEMMNDLGEVYGLLNKYDRALGYYEKSLEYSTAQTYTRLMAISNGNIGKVYLQKKAYDKALKHYTESLKISQEINDLKHTAICLNSMGEINLLLNRPWIARDDFTQAKEISQQSNNQHVLPISLLGIAETFMVEKDYQKALSFTGEAKAIAEDMKLLEIQKKAFQLLATIYENTGQYKKALVSHQQFKILNDSVFNKENIEKITQMEYEYKYKEALDAASIRELKLTKTVMATSQDLARSRQNYLWAIIGILMISIISGSTVFYHKFNTIKAKNQNIVTEQKLLRSQMTPHFIFNSLSILQGMILNKEEKKSITYLSKFSKLLRIVLENSRDKVVPLIQELDAIDNYMILQNMDEGTSFEYNLLVDENIDINLFLIPPMLIQPFIENVIEHAFTDQEEVREITTQLQYINDELICTISDNGIGIDSQNENRKNGKKSLATTITAERLKILSRDFKKKGSVTIEDRSRYNEKGTTVTLVIPYKIFQEE